MSSEIRALLLTAYAISFVWNCIQEKWDLSGLWFFETVAVLVYYPTFSQSWWISTWAPTEGLMLVLRTLVTVVAISKVRGRRLMMFAGMIGVGLVIAMGIPEASILLRLIEGWRLRWLVGLEFVMIAGIGAQWVCGRREYGYMKWWLATLSCWALSAVIDTHVRTGGEWRLNTNGWSLMLAGILMSWMIKDLKDRQKSKSQHESE